MKQFCFFSSNQKKLSSFLFQKILFILHFHNMIFTSAVFIKLEVSNFPWSWTRVINSFADKPWFLRVCNTSLWKTLWEKEKLLVKFNFSFSHSVFYPFAELSAIFIKFEIVICKLFQFGRV